MNRARRSIQGAATVEFAILTTVLVPIVLYCIFLQDTLYYKLNGQEAAMIAPFDHVIIDYNQVDAGDANPQLEVRRVNTPRRQQFCDHTTVYDSFDDPYDCKSQAHHTEHGAHQCWLPERDATNRAEEVWCQTVASHNGEPAAPPGAEYQAWKDAFSSGGASICWDRLAVMNHSIINKFFTWGHEDVTSLRHATESAHDAVSQATGANFILFPQEKIVILTDPWAVNHADHDVVPSDTTASLSNSSATLLARGQTYFSLMGDSKGLWGAGGALKPAEDLLFPSASPEFLQSSARTDGSGDALPTMSMYYAPNDPVRPRAGGNGSGVTTQRSGANPTGYPW